MLEIILVVLALIAIVGACVYFYIDMKDHKATNNTDFEKVNKNIEEEEATRLGNIKYVVDQVNTTNTAMDTEYNNRFKSLQDTDTGFGKLIAAESALGSNIQIKDVATDSKLKLMRDVSVIGSMSIKDLQSTASGSKPVKTFKACGTGTQCIEFPNIAGDTYLTGLADGKSVVSGSLFKAERGLATDTITNFTATNPLTIEANSGITLKSGKHSIEITNDGINIKNTSTPVADPIIKLNGTSVTQSVTIGEISNDTTGSFDAIKVLTLS
jgi:hypothetical protein